MKYDLVWFKRDLRIEDNAALNLAAQNNNPLILLYILEPQLWQQPDLSKRQYDFLSECLIDLEAELKKLGHSLIIRFGEALEVLQQINWEFPISNIYSHQETWNYWTFERDKKVLAWSKSQNIKWEENSQNGVIVLANNDRQSMLLKYLSNK